MRYTLPTAVTLDGVEYAINSDYRDILNIFEAMAEAVELTDEERAVLVLGLFYPEYEKIPPYLYTEALKECFLFINGGEQETPKKTPKLVDWAQDIPYIIAPINRVMGTEVRAVEYMHWYTFLSAYMEIGDCLFAQIVRIRNLKAKGKKLSKEDAAWYRDNRELVDMKQHLTPAEEELLREWGM